MGERTLYQPGTFCWAGLATSDPAAATAFYTRLFDWEAEPLPAGEAGAYTIMRRVGHDVAICYRQTAHARAAGAPPHWTSYISVEDADATAARAGQLGGAAVFRAPFDVPGARVAAIADPAGAVVSLWQPRLRIGATLVNDVGALCWNELATAGLERAKTFFGALLGRQYQASDGGSATITNAGCRNGSIREMTGHGAALAPVFHGRERRGRRAPRRADRRAQARAGHRYPHRAYRGDHRPAGRHIRGLRRPDRPLTPLPRRFASSDDMIAGSPTGQRRQAKGRKRACAAAQMFVAE